MDIAADKPPFSNLIFEMTDPTRDSGDHIVFRMDQCTSDPSKTMDEASVSQPGYILKAKGAASADRPAELSREVPVSTARRLKEKMDALGVFGWEPSYGSAEGDADGGGEAVDEDVLVSLAGKAWKLSVVFVPGVFEFGSSGAGVAPRRFPELLEAFYGFGLPRPGGYAAGEPNAVPRPATAFPSLGGESFEQMQRAITDLQSNPAELQRFARAQFRSLPADQQKTMLDMLGASGIESREWWERFLRG